MTINTAVAKARREMNKIINSDYERLSNEDFRKVQKMKSELIEYQEQRQKYSLLNDDGTLEYLYKGQSILAHKPIKLTEDERKELSNINYEIEIRQANSETGIRL